jgi:hypothetical protein
MHLDLYKAIKTHIQNNCPSVKHVALFNNQFEKANNEGAENSFPYPAVFVQFANVDFTQLQRGVQKVEQNVVLHIGVESYQADEIEFLTLKQDIYKQMTMFENGNFGKLSRITEEYPTDHDNWLVVVQTYKHGANDFTADQIPTNTHQTAPAFTITVSQPPN